MMQTIFFSCAQIYPLNTNTDVPNNAYIKDLNNELISYEGSWKGTWDSKMFILELKKIKKYMTHRENNPYYKDVLIGKFKVLNSSGNILFNNTNILDDDAKIEGARFLSLPYIRYTLSYMDPDICNMSGDIFINFTDATKTKLNWKFSDMTDIITPDCPFYNSNPFPQPLPKDITLTKQ